MDPALQIAAATGIGAGIGAFVGNIFVLINGWRERVAQSRRSQREWAVTAAVEYWKASVQLADSERLRGRAISIFPLDTYLLPMLAIADAIGDNKVSTKNIDALFVAFHSATETAVKHAHEYSKGRQR